MFSTTGRSASMRTGRTYLTRHPLWVSGALLFILGIGIGSLARPSASAASRLTANTTLAFDVQFIGEDTFLDLGAPGFSQGDEIVIHELLLSHGQQVGHSAGVCVITDLGGGPEANCTVTFAVPGGNIMTEFLNSPPPAKTFAITGGTGIYRNARGQGELVESGHETATLTFDLIGGGDETQ